MTRLRFLCSWLGRSKMNKSETLWLNGRYVGFDKADWPIDDRGFTLGDGLFETIRLHDGKPRGFADHWQRLRTSASILGFGDIGDGSHMQLVLQKCAAKNAIKTGSARIVLSRGSGPRGLNLPRVLSLNWLARVFRETPTQNEPVRLALSKIRRCASNPTSRHKTLSHLDMVLSRQFLESGATGNESLVLDTRGRLCCVGAGNLFWVRDGVLYTPSLACAVLPGTTRSRLLANAKIRTGAYWPSTLQQAEAVFITNALIGVRQVSAIDLGRSDVLAFATDHPVLRQLAKLEATD